MATPYINKFFNLSIQGKGYYGQVNKVTPPALKLITEKFRAGGMFASKQIQLGLDDIDFKFATPEADPDTLSLFGLQDSQAVSLNFKGVQINGTGNERLDEYVVRGMITELNRGEIENGKLSNVDYTVNCSYYKHAIGGKTIHEIDIDNNVLIIGGIDQLVNVRNMLGI